ncbi:MAG: efflux RND transporter periplasmic adaptor subunit [Candidatus Moduliflexus flocculans]|nr:efflux RND transporter periplasmic adaptor subunit [Candidatus Moduliflexus flocculans]
MSKAELEKAEKEYQRALSQYNQQKLELESFSRSGRLADLEYQVSIGRAQVDLARRSLENTRIVAPFDGTVLKVDIQPGQKATLATRAITVVESANWELGLYVDQREMPFLKEGLPALVTMDAYPDARIEGAVSYVCSEIDKEKNTCELRIMLKDAPPFIKSGMAGRAEIMAARFEKALGPAREVRPQSRGQWIGLGLGRAEGRSGPGFRSVRWGSAGSWSRASRRARSSSTPRPALPPGSSSPAGRPGRPGPHDRQALRDPHRPQIPAEGRGPDRPAAGRDRRRRRGPVLPLFPDRRASAEPDRADRRFGPPHLRPPAGRPADEHPSRRRPDGGFPAGAVLRADRDPGLAAVLRFPEGRPRRHGGLPGGRRPGLHRAGRGHGERLRQGHHCRRKAPASTGSTGTSDRAGPELGGDSAVVGLTVADKLRLELGDRFFVRNSKGAGETFTVTGIGRPGLGPGQRPGLPVARPGPQLPRPRTASAPSRSRSRRSVRGRESLAAGFRREFSRVKFESWQARNQRAPDGAEVAERLVRGHPVLRALRHLARHRQRPGHRRRPEIAPARHPQGHGRRRQGRGQDLPHPGPGPRRRRLDRRHRARLRHRPGLPEVLRDGGVRAAARRVQPRRAGRPGRGRLGRGLGHPGPQGLPAVPDRGHPEWLTSSPPGTWSSASATSSRPRSSTASTSRFEQGALTAVIGPSGSGKTTLLNIVSLLESPTLGEDRRRRTGFLGRRHQRLRGLPQRPHRVRLPVPLPPARVHRPGEHPHPALDRQRPAAGERRSTRPWA